MAWLMRERNHDGSGGVWLVSWKQATGKPGVPYGDAVDEALCFGWIDSRVNTLYDEVEDLVIPPDLASALADDESAGAHFENFTASAKKNILWWIKSARKPETRAARIARTAELAAQNRMANHPAGRDAGPAARRG